MHLCYCVLSIFTLQSPFTQSCLHQVSLAEIAAVCLIDKNLLLCSNTLTVVQVKRTEGVSSTDIVGRMLMLVRDNNRFSEVCYTRGHALSSTQRWSQQWQTVCSAETHHHHHVLDYLFDCEQSIYMSDSQEITEQSRTRAK